MIHGLLTPCFVYAHIFWSLRFLFVCRVYEVPYAHNIDHQQHHQSIYHLSVSTIYLSIYLSTMTTISSYCCNLDTSSSSSSSSTTSITTSQRTTINPIDPPYQASPDFPPNKTPSWSKQQQQRTKQQQHHRSGPWEHLHQAVRNDVEHCLLKTLRVLAKRSTSLQDWEVLILQSTCRIHMAHLEGYLSQIDDYILPYLKIRINLNMVVGMHDNQGGQQEPPLLLRLLMTKAAAVSEAFENLKEGDTVMTTIPIVTGYLTTLDEYLDRSCCFATTSTISPLFRAFFTPAEAQSLLMKTIGRQSKYENGAFLYHYTAAATADDDDTLSLTTMLASGSELTIPHFISFLVFRPALRAYKRDFVEPLERIERNKPPSFRFLLHHDGSSSSSSCMLSSIRSLSLPSSSSFRANTTTTHRRRTSIHSKERQERNDRN